MSDELLEAALSYARRGWAVFPLAPRSKKPHEGSNGNLDATTDEGQIRLWWATEPRSNIGIATGDRSGFFVVDVDGPDGEEELVRLAVGSTMPETVEALTSRGRHILYERTVPMRNKASIGPSIDIRADGGYIVAPPSIHESGAVYRWDLAHHPDDILISKPPGFIVDAILRKEKPQRSGSPLPGVVLAGQGRNNTLTSLAGTMRRKGASEEAIYRALSAQNDTTCVPPLADSEVRKISRSIARYDPAEEAAAAAADRVEIKVGVDIARVVDEAQQALVADAAGLLYQRGGTLVHIVRDGAKEIKGLTRPPGAPVICVMETARLTELVSSAARWMKYDARSEEDKPCLPPSWVAPTLLARGAWGFPYLEAVVESPCLRPDGTVLDRPGYDAATGILYEPQLAYPPVPPLPTEDEVTDACRTLMEPLEEFPFKGEEDRAAAVAAVLSIVARPAIKGPVPMFVVTAPTPGTGKSLLVDAIVQSASGRSPARFSNPREDDEFKKFLFSVCLEGATTVHMDNVEGALGSPALSMALTAVEIRDRILSTNRTATVPHRAVWFATGNNIQFKGDTYRRVVPINLDAGVEKPEERQFRRVDLHAFLSEAKPRLVCAALTVLRGYLAAGAPSTGKSPFGSYEAWDALVRGAVLHSFNLDPCSGREELREQSDRSLDDLGNLLSAWHTAIPTELPVKVRDLLSKATDYPDLLSSLLAIDIKAREQPRPGPIGLFLRTYKGRVVRGLHLVRVSHDENNTNTALWKVVRS